MKIFLIGMPGSGKTTLGKDLAAHLFVDFIDLDAEIENSERKSIPEIFAQQGEEYFRILEARLLREWAAKTGSFVMATGGGAPCFFQGIDTINQNGLSVFLDCPVSALLERVKKNQERPLLITMDDAQLKEKLERIRTERLSCYRQAKIIIENPNLHSLLQMIHAKN